MNEHLFLISNALRPAWDESNSNGIHLTMEKTESYLNQRYTKATELTSLILLILRPMIFYLQGYRENNN